MTAAADKPASQADINRLEVRIREHANLLRFVQQQDVVELLHSMEAQVLALEGKLNTMRIKQDVLTEVALTCEPGDRVPLLAIMAIDKPDLWWRERAGRFSIADWRAEIAALPVVDLCWQKALGVDAGGGVRTVGDQTVYD